jgi:hypothetical protein
MNTKSFPYKNTIRTALKSLGLGFGLHYYNDICNNSVTHRRFKFTVEDLERGPLKSGLSETELAKLAEKLQESFPEYKVDTKNLLSIQHGPWSYGGNYTIVYLRWKKD